MSDRIVSLKGDVHCIGPDCVRPVREADDDVIFDDSEMDGGDEVLADVSGDDEVPSDDDEVPSAAEDDWIDSLAVAVKSIFQSSLPPADKKKKILALLAVTESKTKVRLPAELLVHGTTPGAILKALAEATQRRQHRRRPKLSVAQLIEFLNA